MGARRSKREWTTRVSIPLDVFRVGTKNKRGGICRGRFYTATGYKNALELLAYGFKSRFRGEPFGWCGVEIAWEKGEPSTIDVKVIESVEAKEKRSDVDSVLTIILDALQQASVIKNDRYIKYTKIEKA